MRDTHIMSPNSKIIYPNKPKKKNSRINKIYDNESKLKTLSSCLIQFLQNDDVNQQCP